VLLCFRLNQLPLIVQAADQTRRCLTRKHLCGSSAFGGRPKTTAANEIDRRPYTDEVQIRRLAEQDAAALWELRLSALEGDPQAFVESAAQHRETPVAVYAERLRSGGRENPVFGAWDAGRIVGMAGLYVEVAGNRRSGRIWGMFVLPEFRGRGVGRELIEALLTHARSLANLEDVRLEVAATQAAARRLYVDWGFTPSGIGPHGADEMRHPLAPTPGVL
jgi:ribosomal protein S18 acetylase RimI-like enzyme